MTKFKEYTPDQMFLLPPSLRDWLSEDHLAYFISDVVDALDLSEIYNDYTSADGQPPYHPLMMVKLLLYAYCVGVPSSRKIEKKTHEDVAFRVLSAGQHPDHDTISEFRRRHLSPLAALFIQVLQLCQKAGLVKLGHVALDSTKVKANASKHKAMSYGRMVEKEKDLLEKVNALLREAEAVDQEEDAKYGKGKRGDELPEELRFHKRRLAKIQEAKAALEAEAREEFLKQQRPSEEKEEPQKKRGRSRKVREENIGKVLPKTSRQRNFTDPDSRIMKDSATQSFVQAYSAQVAVDATSQVIVAAGVVQDAVDKKQLKPMLQKVKENTGSYPDQASADAGYYSEKSVREVEREGMDAYVSPDKIKHGGHPPLVRGRIPKGLSIKERMRRKLWTKRGRATYSKRKETAEPVIGQIKQVRGFRQFLLRGIEKVQPEWLLICTTHNLLKLHRAGNISPRDQNWGLGYSF